MKSIWNGTISFGLVNIPIKVYAATKSPEPSFHYLHQEDLGRISTERICKKCGQSLDYSELVRGYEHERGRYVPLTEEDLDKLTKESMKAIIILDFVDAQEIDPIFFEKPYYLAPDENGEELYVLLREALTRTGKVGVAKFTWYEREHLAMVKANEQTLVLNILHFVDEIAQPEGFRLPAQNIQLGEEELALAERLIGTMTNHFSPERYTNTYSQDLRALIDKKLAGLEIEAKPVPRAPTQVAELRAKLQVSIEKAEHERKQTLAA
jgi:DNA end-binding protein Ku